MLRVMKMLLQLSLLMQILGHSKIYAKDTITLVFALVLSFNDNSRPALQEHRLLLALQAHGRGSVKKSIMIAAVKRPSAARNHPGHRYGFREGI